MTITLKTVTSLPALGKTPIIKVYRKSGIQVKITDKDDKSWVARGGWLIEVLP